MVDLRFWGRISRNSISHIIAKDRKIPLKIKLIEKSSKKVNFLKIKQSKHLSLNVEVINKNIIEGQVNFNGDVFVARAFQAIKNAILELIHNKAKSWKKFLFFWEKQENQNYFKLLKFGISSISKE